MLTETKRLDIVPDQSDWDDDQDFTVHRDTASLPPPPANSANTDTVPKTITQTESSFGRACRKTKFLTNTHRSTAVISGQPAGSEDIGEYKEYFNPCIFPWQSLYTTNPIFTATVNICRQWPHNSAGQIETVRRHPWDNQPHGRNTRSQEALRRKAEKKVTKRYPNYSPRRTYVRDFQFLAKPHTINVHRDIYKHLDLTTAFKGLTIVTFTDEKSESQPSTSKQKDQRPFFYASLSPSPTTTEEEAEIPELVDIPLPEEVEKDQLPIEDSDWSPPPVAY